MTSKDSLGDAFFNLIHREKIGGLIAIVIFICLIFVVILSGLVKENTKEYWKFLEQVTVPDIEKIQVQRIELTGKVIGDSIILSEQDVFAGFISAVKTAQKNDGQRFYSESGAKVTVWLKNNRVIEFECIKHKDYGKDILVRNIFIRPNIYSFGSGDAVFPASDFYD